ncbi:MAG: penicillin acylase family protein [Bacteroidota bacterium]
MRNITDIFWDVYNVPHVFAPDVPSLSYAFGRAQMRCHADLLLRLYGQARGRGAEYWGEDYLAADRLMMMMNIPERAREWYDLQHPWFRECLDAFADGINDYSAEHPDEISDDVRLVLPITATDILAHCHRVVNFLFVVDIEQLTGLIAARMPLGSNAWAIAPSRSAGGHAMLLSNPHLPWSDLFLLFEADLKAPQVDVYGATPVGFPVLTFAFNDFLGWTHTVNTCRGWTLYELELAPGGYFLDGEIVAFETEEKFVAIRRGNGEIDREQFIVQRSLHGLVVAHRNGSAYALRVAGLDRPAPLEQWWDMARATNLSEFEHALRKMQIPTLTVMYADREGHIMHFFNGQIPVRDHGDVDYWANVVPGNRTSELWSRTHDYDELPRVVDPSSGWLQNANDPPWTTTFPSELRADLYPSYMAPRGPMSMRAQRSARMLAERPLLSFEDIVTCRYATRMELADRVVDDLVGAARCSRNPIARHAAEVLAAWDRAADAESRGAVLFALWARAIDLDTLFETPWSPERPLSTPCGLRDPEHCVALLAATAAEVESRYGALDIQWGELFQLSPGAAQASVDIIGHSLGIFPELWFTCQSDGSFGAVGGDSFAAVVEFANPVRAMVLNVCGNTNRPELRVGEDQADLYRRKQMRPAWRSRREIMSHLALQDICSYALRQVAPE